MRTSCADGEPATLTGATLVRRWSEHPCATSAADEETDDTEESAECADQADRSNDYDVESASYVQSNSGSPITVPGTADVASQRLCLPVSQSVNAALHGADELWSSTIRVCVQV